MVYTNPTERTDIDRIFGEDPIAIVEAENADILQGGYEPLPQEPELPEFDRSDYCPLRDDDSKMDTFCYYIKHPPSPEPKEDYLDPPEPVSQPKEDYMFPPQRKIFPQAIVTKNDTFDEILAGPSGSQINMDAEKVEEVKKIMVNINLPASYIPEWAEEVPEEQWKDFILERLHMKRSKGNTD